MLAPDIINSAKEEREEYIKENYKCKSNCEICGMCQVFKGKTAEVVFKDYIDGIRDYAEVCKDFRG